MSDDVMVIPDERDCHIIATPGDARTLCGRRTDDVGVGWAPFIQAHIDGHRLAVCIDCERLWRNTIS